MNDNEHNWTRERVETFLAGGLTDAEIVRFESHVAECEMCAGEIETARAADDSLHALFKSARPANEFEDRLVSRLRSSRRWWVISPAVRHAATGVAAVLILGAAGFIVSETKEGNDILGFLDVRIPAAQVTNARYQNPAEVWKDSTYGVDGPAATISPDDMARTINGVAEAHIRGTVVVPDGGTVLLGGMALNQEGNGRVAGQMSDPTFNLSLSEDEKTKAITEKLGMEGGGGSGGSGNALGDDGYVKGTAVPGRLWADEALGRAVGNRGGISDGNDGAPREVDGDFYYAFKDAQTAPAKAESARFKPTEIARNQPVPVSTEARAGVAEDRLAGVKKEAAQQGQQPGAAGNLAADPVEAPATTPQPVAAAPADRKIIRNGELEFEVDSFDSSFVNIARIVTEESGFIGTTNSEKLPNGKVKGVIVVRVPPDRLDVLVLKLRALGELKSQKITALDVTKQFVDSESELRAARAMEERLLEIIKSGKGEIKELLAAEKELGVWRSKIEKIEGELRYLASQVSLSTLTISLYEKDLKTPTAAFEQETANIGVETVDVETARADALKAIDEAKGRVIESDLKKHDAGQLAARIVAEVSPESSGGVIDRLKQLGKVARLEIERKQTTAGGTGSPTPGVRVEKRDTRLVISLYNLANVAPRETVSLNIAAKDVESAYRAVLASVEKAGGRVVTSNLNRAKADQTTGSINFEVPAAQGGAVEAEVRIVGDVMRLAVTENPDTENVTRAKRGYVVQLYSLAQVAPRETVVLQLASEDVTAAYGAMLSAAQAAEARVLVSRLDQQDRENVTAHLDIEVTREKLEALTNAQAKAGEVYSQNVNRSSDTENTVDSKVRMQMTFINVNRLAPRETTTMGVETNNVEKTMGDVLAQATAAGGRVVTSNLSKESSGRSSAKVIVDVPLAEAQKLITSIRDAGIVRMIQSSRNPQVPDGKLARARIDLTLANADLIVAQDDGFGSAIKSGLSKSITGLLWSLQLIVIGLCFVGPWVVILWLMWRYVMRRKATA